MNNSLLASSPPSDILRVGKATDCSKTFRHHYWRQKGRQHNNHHQSRAPSHPLQPLLLAVVKVQGWTDHLPDPA